VPDIFDEVEEDLRAERMRALLTRYAGVVLLLGLVVLGGVAAWQGWDWYQARQDRFAAQTYITAMLAAGDTGPVAAPARAQALGQFLALSRTAPTGYRTLARLHAAALEADAGHLPQALALWNAVAADQSADPLLRGLAGLLWADRQLDSADPGVLAARLKTLATPGAPWRALAEEDLALLDLRQHRDADAKRRLDALAKDPTTPAGVRQQAAALSADIDG